MQFTEFDFEFSRSYDQFITACSSLGIPTTHLFIQLHLFVLFQVLLGKSTIDDGALASIMFVNDSINYGRLALSLSMTSINNGGLVKTFEAPFDKPMLGWLFQYFHLYF